jgi:hypothetical protein
LGKIGRKEKEKFKNSTHFEVRSLDYGVLNVILYQIQYLYSRLVLLVYRKDKTNKLHGNEHDAKLNHHNRDRC